MHSFYFIKVSNRYFFYWFKIPLNNSGLSVNINMVMNMWKNLIDKFRHLDKITYKIMKNGFKFSFILACVSLFLLITYMLFYSAPLLYYIGISVFKLSLTFGIEFLVCGFAVDTIKKQMIN